MAQRTIDRVPRYGRCELTFAPGSGIDRVVFTAPDGSAEVRPAFASQPAQFEYDEHGYERVAAAGPVAPAARFTPTVEGRHVWTAMRGESPVESGELFCEPSEHPGYVGISTRDPRYFACSDGTPFVPVGLNLCWPPFYPLPAGRTHFAASDERATLGLRDYERWLRQLARHGGNFVRIWASSPYFEVEGETAGVVDPLRFAMLDGVVALARTLGVRLKICLEHWRRIDGPPPFGRSLRHPDSGRPPANTAEWFRARPWRQCWLRKLDAFTARYGGDPTVMAFELWNEINCCETGDWQVQLVWTREMLRELKARAPRQLAVNSLGSYDSDWSRMPYEDFKREELDFQQVHRYVDQGASYPVCRDDAAALGPDAIASARRPDRPVLLAETGAVNDCHTGPFRFYRHDDRGILFHDTTFPAFFAGAAGTGQVWHWDSYVDFKNLWSQFGALAEVLDGVKVDEEGFRPVDLSTKHAWFLALAGRRHFLAWVRSRYDTWQRVLRDGKDAEMLRFQMWELYGQGVTEGKVTLHRPWPDGPGRAELANGRLVLPPFRYGFFVKIRLAP